MPEWVPDVMGDPCRVGTKRYFRMEMLCFYVFLRILLAGGPWEEGREEGTSSPLPKAGKVLDTSTKGRRIARYGKIWADVARYG